MPRADAKYQTAVKRVAAARRKLEAAEKAGRASARLEQTLRKAETDMLAEAHSMAKGL